MELSSPQGREIRPDVEDFIKASEDPSKHGREREGGGGGGSGFLCRCLLDQINRLILEE